LNAKDQPPLVNQFNNEPEQNILITSSYDNPSNSSFILKNITFTQPFTKFADTSPTTSASSTEQINFKPSFTDSVTTTSISNGISHIYSFTKKLYIFSFCSILVYICG
jgi:hypothetical protein